MKHAMNRSSLSNSFKQELNFFVKSDIVKNYNNHSKKDMINSMNAHNARDLGPHNLILNGHELLPIDQEDKLDDVNTKEKLKLFLIQSGLL